MSDIKLGTVPDENSVRDAIHIAIYPLIAGELLKPGQQIGIIDDKGFLNAPKKIGIVAGGKKILTNRSEGNYKIDGSIIYFYPNPGSGIMIAGIDPEKNTRYMKINSYGNLEYLRENDYETVLLNKR